MIIPLNQSNAGDMLLSIPRKIAEVPNKLNTLKEGTIEAIVALTFIDQMAIVIIISLIILKILGFDNLEKWILLTILLKVVAMVLI